MSDRSRGDLLADLADSINQLVEPRHVTEIVEQNVIDRVVSRSGRVRERRRKMRRPHVVTLPGLLESLRQAAVPGATEAGGGSGASFESRPSADLEPVSVLRDIADEAHTYARALNVKAKTLSAVLHSLVGAHHSDGQLRNLTVDAARWVRRAKQATGFDPAPITLNEACPYCLRRHALVITGDLQGARCTRCGTLWSHDTIGLLADMLRANETVETLAVVRCCWADCTRTGPHDVHEDHRGRTWRRESRCVDGDGVPAWTA